MIDAIFRSSNPVGGSIIALGVIAWDYVDYSVDPAATPEPCPNPLEDCELDWVFLWTLPLVGTTGAFLGGNANGPDRDRASKAKRRLGSQSSILVVIASIGVTVNYHAHVRCLIKE